MYLTTPMSMLLMRLTALHVKTFGTFNGITSFIAVFTKAIMGFYLETRYNQVTRSCHSSLNSYPIILQRNFTQSVLTNIYVEIKCQLDATEVFIADLIAFSTCFRHHYAHHQELKSIIQWLLVCRMLQHPANRTHNTQLHTRPAT